MSQIPTMVSDVASGEPRAEATPRAPAFDFERILKSPALIPGLILAVSLCLVFWTMVQFLPNLWQSEDGYYSHGWLIPAMSGVLIWRWWPKLSQLPAKPFWPALIPLAACLWVTRVAHINTTYALLSVCFIGTIICGVWFVAGFRWALLTSPAVLYLAFGLPLWESFINLYTNPLQIHSTEISYQLLQAFGFDPYRDSPTVIIVNSFMLNVDVPCSGLKLLLALSAFSVFFVLYSRLKLWANAILLAMIVPLAIFINGLRIALIGVVGEMYGEDAGMKFHDYSGYITLLVCFFILFKTARLLGWKD
jgi:exosortase